MIYNYLRALNILKKEKERKEKGIFFYFILCRVSCLGSNSAYDTLLVRDEYKYFGSIR